MNSGDPAPFSQPPLLVSSITVCPSSALASCPEAFPPRTPGCCRPVHLLPLNAPQLSLRFRKEICLKPPRTFLLRQQVKSWPQGHCPLICEVLSDSASCHSHRRAGCPRSSCTSYPTASRTLFLLEQGRRLANPWCLVPHMASCA